MADAGAVQATQDTLADLLANLPEGDRAYVIERVANAAPQIAASSSGRRSSRGGGVAPSVDSGPTGQRFMLWSNYYSIIRFQAQVSVVGATTTLTFIPTVLKPFSYRVNDPLVGAGFDASIGNATEAETNLTKAGETLGGETVRIDGVSLMPSNLTDIGLWKQLCDNIAVSISMDGDARTYKLGRPTMLPGSGGTFGSGLTSTVLPDLQSSLGADSGFSNGWPVIDNFYPLDQPIWWTPSGETDSNFNLVLRLVRQQVSVQTGRAAATGVAPFTPPTAVGQVGTYVDFMARLHSMQEAARSVNS